MNDNCYLQIIGWAKPHLEAETASTSLLFSGDRPERSLLVDCGHGAVSSILRLGLLDAIGAVVITHLHPDHWADLFALRNALLASETDRKVLLFIGPGNDGVIGTICETMSIGRRYFSDFFDMREFDPGQPLSVLDFTISFFPTQHSIETYGVNIRYRDSLSMSFSADTGPYPELCNHMAGASTVIVECNSQARAEGAPVHLCVDDVIALVERLPRCQTVCVTHYPLSERTLIKRRLEGALPELSIQMADTGLVLQA